MQEAAHCRFSTQNFLTRNILFDKQNHHFMENRAIALVLIFTAMRLLSTSADGQSLGVALNATNLTWTTSGTAGLNVWSGETGIGQDGVAAESGSLGIPTSTSTLQTTVTGPGTLTFGWYVPSEYLILSFNVNGVTQETVGPEMSSWQQQTNYLGSGTQTLQWIASVFSSPGSGHDYVDEVTFTAGATAPFFTNQTPNQSQVQGLSNTFYAGADGTPPLSYQWLFNNSNISGATSSSYTVASVQATNLGTYSVMVTNGAGTNTMSSTLQFGNVTEWGSLLFGQTDVAPGATNVLAISGGWQHSLALQSNGTILAWGSNGYGQASIPANLTNVIAIAAGGENSLVLMSNGTVLEWGDNSSGQTNLPAGLTNVVAIALSTFDWPHSLALKANGTVTAWGDNTFGESTVPSGLSNVVAVAAGEIHSLALQSDGTVVAWGDNSYGETTVPSGLTNVTAIAAGGIASMALTPEGTVVQWGLTEANPPTGLTSVMAIAMGEIYGMALLSNGTVVAWGENTPGSSGMPTGLTNVVQIAAGPYNDLALVGNEPPIVNALLTNPSLSSQGFSVSLPSQSGRVYELEYENSLTAANWSALPLAAGNGTNIVLTDPTVSSSGRFYRVLRW
jgi:hypothetical protein